MIVGSDARGIGRIIGGETCDTARALYPLVGVSQLEVPLAGDPPGQINSCFTPCFKNWLPSISFLMDEIYPELESVRKKSRSPNEEIDSIGSHVMTKFQFFKPHATRIDKMVVPTSGSTGAPPSTC